LRFSRSSEDVSTAFQSSEILRTASCDRNGGFYDIRLIGGNSRMASARSAGPTSHSDSEKAPSDVNQVCLQRSATARAGHCAHTVKHQRGREPICDKHAQIPRPSLRSGMGIPPSIRNPCNSGRHGRWSYANVRSLPRLDWGQRITHMKSPPFLNRMLGRRPTDAAVTLDEVREVVAPGMRSSMSLPAETSARYTSRYSLRITSSAPDTFQVNVGDVRPQSI